MLVDTNFINFSIKNKVRLPPTPFVTPPASSAATPPAQRSPPAGSTFPAAPVPHSTPPPRDPLTHHHPPHHHTHPQIDLVRGMMDCLYAECTPVITDCVMAELEKLGQKYRVALKVAKVRGRLGEAVPDCRRVSVVGAVEESTRLAGGPW